MGDKKTNTDSRALYRRYRSKSLSEIIGQSHVTTILSRALEQGRIAHAYLLTGPRGVGKTSIARILAHEINQLPYDDDRTHLDIIEIDAASNNGVEDVRDLREKVQIAPVSAAKKVYIIDEVHMLSKAAFNALLKTLEEPPEHVVFILATTDVDKLPATIISRTQRYGLRAISPGDAVTHLRTIADQENIKIDDNALQLIAERGEGSLRDSTSILDQLANMSDPQTGITIELAETVLGLAPISLVDQLVDAVTHHQQAAVISLLEDARQQGVTSTVLCHQLLTKLRSVILEKPMLIPLLDQLLEVAKSSQPDLKLLTILAKAAASPKSAALSAPLPSVSAPIHELEKAAGTPHPEKIVKPAAVPVPEEKSEKKSTKKQAAASGSLDKLFDFPKLIEHTKEHYVAVYSVLSKCSHEIQDGTLRLYCLNKFYKTKLDDPKYRSLLHESLAHFGIGAVDIETIPAAPPPKDSQAAAVAAIMGGGEEVSLETV